MITGPPTLDTYLAMVTSEHRDKPNFIATLTARIQPLVDIMATLWEMFGIFNPNATGDQLDQFAKWVGVSRTLPEPLQNVFFSWGVAGVGWGQGTWLGPGDNSAIGLTELPDDAFQLLVKLVILMNNWDGTIPGAYTIWESVMRSGFPILIQDNQDMTMLIVFPGQIESVVTIALIVGGYFNMRPAGVRINEFAQPSVSNTPVFGWGVENSTISGWGTGCWIEPLVS